MRNVYLNKFPIRISLLFPITIYTKILFIISKKPYIKSSRHHKSLSFKGPKSRNKLCLNKLLFKII